MKFEWDPLKALENLRKHGIAFKNAILAFDDPYALRADDPKHSTPLENREILIGLADDKVLVVVFTVRRNEVYRLISARPASKKERFLYETLRTIPF